MYYNALYNTNIDTPCMGELMAYRRSTEARWPITGARVSSGKFERLLQFLLLRCGDPHAFLGSILLDIFTVSGPIFSVLVK